MKPGPVICCALAACLAAGCGEDGIAPVDPWPVVLDPPTATASDAAPPGDPDWHRKIVFYELWVRSFQDSDGDGIGDMAGLIERLDYLEELGVGGIWLMPIYPSPLADSGYDVADYVDVHRDYGTVADFDTLIAAAQTRNIRVFVDLVFNHTSDQHEWFIESRSDAAGAKGDWFIWADEPGLGCTAAPVGFGDERWSFDDTRGQYYFHQFYPRQPELNFDSPALQEGLLDVMRFWLDRGVDGFRLDVAHRYHDMLPQCTDTEGTRAFHRRMREVTDDYQACTMVGEVDGTADVIVDNFGDGDDALHMAFYLFGILDHRLAAMAGTVDGLRDSMDTLVALTPPGATHANVIGNHDVPRFSDSVGNNLRAMKVAATAMMTLPGVPFVYYGEEIGLPNGPDWVVDSRDRARTPMQWDRTATAGFTSGTPWLTLAGDVDRWSVAAQEGIDGSLLEHYRRLVAMHNGSPALQTGSYERLDTDHPRLYAFLRRHDSGHRLVLLHFGLADSIQLALPLPEPFANAAKLADEITLRQIGPVHSGVLEMTVPPRTGLVVRTVE
jgi:alpha-glucosidase